MTTPKQSNEKTVDPAARSGHQTPPATSQSSQPVELIRLLRHPQSGQLIVEVAGQRYTKLADISEKEIGQYILQITAHLLAFTNGMIATDAGLRSTYNPKVGQTPRPLLAPTPVSQLPDPMAYPPSPPSEPARAEPALVPRPSPEAEEAFRASLQARPPQPEPQQQRRGLFGRPKRAEEPKLLPALNLAEQINEIVQVRLMASPLAETTNLDITADPGGGIRIKVNDAFYSSPDDIPDPEVKALIKASIKQWERT